jgi:prolyl-tRNA synthetase
LTKALIQTLREDPSDAEIPSHKLMIRAGLMSKLTAGVYVYMPLGLKAIQKVEAIVRDELDKIGCQEVLMPVISPAELWLETGRWHVYGKELMRLKDRHDREFALGPTHEEVVTDLARGRVRSYRKLPMTLYQIQTKFRDEIRPRFGVIRSREFIMKDAYSFHEDEASLDESYNAMYQAYQRIFDRCGLDTRAVEAHSGAIGGDVSHEFMALAENGESEVITCACGYTATSEQASGRAPAGTATEEGELQKVSTPGMRTVEEVAGSLQVDPTCIIKTILYQTDGGLVAAMVRGDRGINDAKLTRALGADAIGPATPEAIEAATKAPVGFSGPVGLQDVSLIADYSIEGMEAAVVGANEKDAHYVNAKPGRDFEVDRYADIMQVCAGDQCADCGRSVESYRGIEVGQVFRLGTKYSTSMNATFLDSNGNEVPFLMGCYGIGITRTVAAVIEQNHDEDGICWPLSVAPFTAEVLAVNPEDDEVKRVSEEIYEDLKSRGIDVLLDDRVERPGSKFKDADLIGLPLRVTVGERSLEKGVVEIRQRKTGDTMSVPPEEAVARVLELTSKLE